MWECTTCYDNAIHDNAEVMDGTYMTLKYLPFEEAKSNPMLATYLKYVGKYERQRLLGVRMGGGTRVRRGREQHGEDTRRQRSHPRQPAEVAE